MLKALNDVALIEIERNQYELGGMKLAGGDSKQGVENGILRELPEELVYLGFHAFAFEQSLVNDEKLQKIANIYTQLIGKRVYWKALSDRGMVLERDGKAYAMIKLTDLIGYSEADENWSSVNTDIKF